MPYSLDHFERTVKRAASGHFHKHVKLSIANAYSLVGLLRQNANKVEELQHAVEELEYINEALAKKYRFERSVNEFLNEEKAKAFSEPEQHLASLRAVARTVAEQCITFREKYPRAYGVNGDDVADSITKDAYQFGYALLDAVNKTG